MADVITNLDDDSIVTTWPHQVEMAGGDDDTTDEGSPDGDDDGTDGTDDDTSDADQDGTDS